MEKLQMMTRETLEALRIDLKGAIDRKEGTYEGRGTVEGDLAYRQALKAVHRAEDAYMFALDEFDKVTT
jgi:hypothetical protein